MLCARSGRGSHPRGRLNRRCLRLEVRVAWSFVLPFTASCSLIRLRLAILFSSFAARRASSWTSFSMSRCGEQAANAFVAYVQRRRQSRAGSPKWLLVDFIVAAHALHRADRLMTLDANRYRQDFPKLRLL